MRWAASNVLLWCAVTAAQLGGQAVPVTAPNATVTQGATGVTTDAGGLGDVRITYGAAWFISRLPLKGNDGKTFNSTNVRFGILFEFRMSPIYKANAAPSEEETCDHVCT